MRSGGFSAMMGAKGGAYGRFDLYRVGVGPGGGLRDQLLRYHVEHGPRREAQQVGEGGQDQPRCQQGQRRRDGFHHAGEDAVQERVPFPAAAGFWLGIGGMLALDRLQADRSIPLVDAFVERNLGVRKADRVLLYNPDCVGLWLYQKYTDLFI